MQVNGHDFLAGVPKAIPYGVYDIGADAGFVSVGVDHDTAPFAVNALRRLQRPPAAGVEGRAGQAGRRDRPGYHGLPLPPGTSKWNKVEHRLFSFISINWRGWPLTDYQVVVETIAATTTETGLRVEAALDPGTYPTGVKVSNKQIKAVPLTRHPFHASGTTPSILDRSQKSYRIRHLARN